MRPTPSYRTSPVSDSGAMVSLEIDVCQSQRAVETAHRLFSRVLLSWASDVLELRRRSELTPKWKSNASGSSDWSMNEAA